MTESRNEVKQKVSEGKDLREVGYSSVQPPLTRRALQRLSNNTDVVAKLCLDRRLRMECPREVGG